MATKKRSVSSPAKSPGSSGKPARAPASKEVSASGDASVHPRVNFIKNVKFVGLGLDKSSCTLDRIALAKARQQEAQLEVHLKIDQSVLAHEEDYFVVSADFELAQTIKDSDEPIVSITATFSARFDLVVPADQEMVRAFSAVEARLIFFPYLRHFVSDTTYRMTSVPIVLPLTSELEG